MPIDGDADNGNERRDMTVPTDECSVPTDECIVQTDERMVEMNECMLKSDKCMVQTDDCMVQTDECMVQTKDCMVQTDECRMQTNECKVQTNECGMQTDECMVQTDEHMVQTRDRALNTAAASADLMLSRHRSLTVYVPQSMEGTKGVMLFNQLCHYMLDVLGVQVQVKPWSRDMSPHGVVLPCALSSRMGSDVSVTFSKAQLPGRMRLIVYICS